MWGSADLSDWTIHEARTTAAFRHAFLSPIRPERYADERRSAVRVIETKPILAAGRRACSPIGFAHGLTGLIRTLCILTGGRGFSVGIHDSGTFESFRFVSIDVCATASEPKAIFVDDAVDVDAHTEARELDLQANVILRAVDVEVARYATIDATPVLASESEGAIEARRATGGRLDAAVALTGDFHAFALGGTIRGRVAGTASREVALLDRSAL